MWVARISTLAIGALVMLGALFVDNFGGAFEASKLFASLFAIPLIIPVLFGILVRKASPSGAWISLVTGILTGLILNYMPEVSWQLATFLTISVCLLVFLGSGLWARRDEIHQEKIHDFFQRLRTAIDLVDKPSHRSGIPAGFIDAFSHSIGIGRNFISRDELALNRCVQRSNGYDCRRHLSDVGPGALFFASKKGDSHLILL